MSHMPVMTTLRTLRVLTLLACATVLAACGGDTPSTGAPADASANISADVQAWYAARPELISFKTAADIPRRPDLGRWHGPAGHWLSRGDQRRHAV